MTRFPTRLFGPVLVLIVTVTLAVVPRALAQPPGGELVPLTIEVTIARYDGDELISSLPYVLSTTANEIRSKSSLRMGADVPILQIAQMTTPDGEPVPGLATGGPFTYRPVGTNIDCFTTKVGDDRFQVMLNIEDSSVYGEKETSVDNFKATGVPVFRSYQSQNTLLLRDGQSVQYTAAADRVTGQSVQVGVKLTVLP